VYQWLNPILKPIDTFNPRFTINGEYFYITDVQRSDKGKYTCVATNVKDFLTNATAVISEVYGKYLTDLLKNARCAT
jgi:hypothetical protein